MRYEFGNVWNSGACVCRVDEAVSAGDGKGCGGGGGEARRGVVARVVWEQGSGCELGTFCGSL